MEYVESYSYIGGSEEGELGAIARAGESIFARWKLGRWQSRSGGGEDLGHWPPTEPEERPRISGGHGVR